MYVRKSPGVLVTMMWFQFGKAARVIQEFFLFRLDLRRCLGPVYLLKTHDRWWWRPGVIAFSQHETVRERLWDPLCRFQTSTLLKACSVFGPQKGAYLQVLAPPKMAMPLHKGPIGSETSKGTCWGRTVAPNWGAKQLSTCELQRFPQLLRGDKTSAISQS